MEEKVNKRRKIRQEYTIEKPLKIYRALRDGNTIATDFTEHAIQTRVYEDVKLKLTVYLENFVILQKIKKENAKKDKPEAEQDEDEEEEDSDGSSESDEDYELIDNGINITRIHEDVSTIGGLKKLILGDESKLEDITDVDKHIASLFSEQFDLLIEKLGIEFDYIQVPFDGMTSCDSLLYCDVV